MVNNNAIKESRGDLLVNFINFLILSLFLIVILYPLIYIVSASFSSAESVISGKMWLWPIEPTLDGYTAVFQYHMFWKGLLNSLTYTVFGTILNVILTVLAGYALSRKDLYGRNVIMVIFVFTMFFNGGLIPTYILIKQIGLLNTGWAMIIPTALTVWNVIIARTFFQVSIPEELLEASKIDGCSDTSFFLKVVVPLSGPIIAVLALFYAVSHWNQFFAALLYLKSQKLFPLQLVLRDILVQNEISVDILPDIKDAAALDNMREKLKYAMVVIASLPLLMIYPFVQKYFVKGIMIGSLKG